MLFVAFSSRLCCRNHRLKNGTSLLTNEFQQQESNYSYWPKHAFSQFPILRSNADEMTPFPLQVLRCRISSDEQLETGRRQNKGQQNTVTPSRLAHVPQSPRGPYPQSPRGPPRAVRLASGLDPSSSPQDPSACLLILGV